VIIAAIVAMEPALLLLDEPTAELDAAGARLLWSLVRTLAADGTAVVVATSDVDAIVDVADRVAWLEGGRVVKTGTPALLADEVLCAAGLGTTVAGVWRAAQLPAPYPATVTEAVQRWR
jgi:energy-coupling factor transport system ATP-binding protein